MVSAIIIKISNCVICTICECFCCHSDPKAVFEFGVRERDRFFDGIQCVGNEANLLRCNIDGFEETNCSHYEAAGVSCGNSPSDSL